MKAATSLLLILSLALSLALPAAAATTALSSLTNLTVVSTNDDLIINATNTGAGTWTTKRATVGKVIAGAMPLLSSGFGVLTNGQTGQTTLENLSVTGDLTYSQAAGTTNYVNADGTLVLSNTATGAVAGQDTNLNSFFYHSGVYRTNSEGNVTISGTNIAAYFVGDGSQLTGVNSTNLSGATLSNATIRSYGVLQRPIKAFFVGDSLTAPYQGYNAPTNINYHSYPEYLLALPWWQDNIVESTNVGVTTTGLYWATNRWAADVANRLAPAPTNNVLFLWVGANDYDQWPAPPIAGSISNAASWVSTYENYCSNAIAAGMTVVAFTIQNRAHNSALTDQAAVADLDTMNSAIRRSTNHHYLVDLAVANADMSTNANNRTYDGTHPTTNGAIWTAQFIDASVKANLASQLPLNIQAYRNLANFAGYPSNSGPANFTYLRVNDTTGGGTDNPLIVKGPIEVYGPARTYGRGTLRYTCSNDGLGTAEFGYYNGATWALAASLGSNGMFTATSATLSGGLTMSQLVNIPTNSIPASTSSVTNYVLLNLTNTFPNGGGPCFVATNVAAAGSFLVHKISITTATWP